MKKLVTDLSVEDKKVLLRVDFNVPIIKNKIMSDTRILGAIPTIKYLTDNGAKVIIVSHLGRPKGKVVKKYSLKPVASHLGKLLNEKVLFASDTVGEDAVKKAKSLKKGQILVLENSRFNPEEKTNDDKFSKKLASLADLYVNDAFGTSHRKHASVYGVAKLLPNAIGFLVADELNNIGGALNNPKRPFVAILGGAKVEDKLGVIDNLLEKVDTLIIGGAMAYTFHKALGANIGKSLVDNNQLDYCYKVVKKAINKGVKIILPQDNICNTSLESETKPKVFTTGSIEDDYMGLDVGPRTIKSYKKIIKKARTIMWNGPLGVFENPKYGYGTSETARLIAKNKKAFSIIGGGDTASAVETFNYDEAMSHISTGGGASLMMLEGKELPAISVIENIEG